MPGAGFFWKELTPLVGLIVTTFFVVYLNKRSAKALTNDVVLDQVELKRRIMNFNSLFSLSKGKEQLKREFFNSFGAFFVSVLAVILFLLLCLAVNLPAFIQTTHTAVTTSKEVNRDVCRTAMTDFDYAQAETAIRNNTVGIELFHKMKTRQRLTLDKLFQKTFELLFFRIGTLWSAIPLFFLFFLHILLQTVQVNSAVTKVSQLFIGPESVKSMLNFFQVTDADAAALLPALNYSLASAWTVFCCYFFFLRDLQIRNCVLLSGHWYTFCHTLLSTSVIVSYLYSVQNSPYNSNRNWISITSQLYNYYIAFLVFYVAITFRIFVDSMTFFHDNVESIQGIKSALSVVPIVLGVSLYVMNQSLEFRKNSVEAALGCVPKQYDFNLKPGNKYIVISKFSANKEIDNSINVEENWRVEVLNVPTNGWVLVKDLSTAKAGFVPAALLRETTASESDSESKVVEATNMAQTRTQTKASEVSKTETEKLKTTLAPPSKKPPINFLSEIKQGVKLKHISDKTAEKNKNSGGQGKKTGELSLMEALQQKLKERSQVIQEEDSE